MTSIALNNLWTFIQSIGLSNSNKQWLADKLIESKTDNKEIVAAAEDTVVDTSVLHELARKICTEEEYQALCAEGFIDNPKPQYYTIPDDMFEQRVREAEASGYVSAERSETFMKSLLEV